MIQCSLRNSVTYDTVHLMIQWNLWYSETSNTVQLMVQCDLWYSATNDKVQLMIQCYLWYSVVWLMIQCDLRLQFNFDPKDLYIFLCYSVMQSHISSLELWLIPIYEYFLNNLKWLLIECWYPGYRPSDLVDLLVLFYKA